MIKSICNGFRKLSEEDAGSLESPISMEEVTDAVWNCDSLKSQGLDGLNFRFIKR